MKIIKFLLIMAVVIGGLVHFDVITLNDKDLQSKVKKTAQGTVKTVSNLASDVSETAKAAAE